MSEDLGAAPITRHAMTKVSLTTDMMRRFMALETPIRPHVFVEGLERTRLDVIDRDLAFIEGATSVHDLVARINTVRFRWMASHFRDVSFNIEPTSSKYPTDIAVVMEVKENTSGSFLRLLPTDTATPQLTFGFGNLRGGAYTLLGHVHTTGRAHETGATLLSKAPLFGNSCEYDVSIRKDSGGAASQLAFAEERIQEAKLVVHHLFSQRLAHALTFSFTRRLLVPLGKVDPTLYDSPEFGAAMLHVDPSSASAPPTMQNMSSRASTTTSRMGSAQQVETRELREYASNELFALRRKGSLISELRYDNTITHRHPTLRMLYPLPIAGVSFDLRNELAGWMLGGDHTFCKTDLTAHTVIPLHPYFILDLAARVGAAWTPSPALTQVHRTMSKMSFRRRPGSQSETGTDAATSADRLQQQQQQQQHARSSAWLPYSDRFFLSWRHVRGHETIGDQASLGSTTKTAATGGNAVWALSASLNMPFWLYPQNGLAALHVFANAGNVAMYNTLSELRRGWGDLFRNHSLAVGAGLVITQVPLLGPLSNGRLELNVSCPMQMTNGKISAARGTEGMPALRRIRNSLRFGLVWSSAVCK